MSLVTQGGPDALAAAVRSNDAANVRAVLAQFPELKASLDDEMVGGDFGATPLLTAVNQRNREMVDALLAAGPTSTSAAIGGPAASACSTTMAICTTS